MRNKTYRKDLTDGELEHLMQQHIDSLMQQVVQCQKPEPVMKKTPSEKSKEEPSSGKNHREDQEKVTGPEREYLESIPEHPFLSITGRAELLGLSAYSNDKLKKCLLGKEWVREFAVNLGFGTRGNVKFLELTEAGYQVIGKTRPKEQRGTCSSEHWFWQKVFQATYSKKGYRAIIELNLKGKRADIGLKKNGLVIALEIELSPKNVVCNVKKDLAAGFDKVLVACKNTKVMKQARQKLEGVLTQDEWSKVKIHLIQDFKVTQELIPKTKT